MDKLRRYDVWADYDVRYGFNLDEEGEVVLFTEVDAVRCRFCEHWEGTGWDGSKDDQHLCESLGITTRADFGCRNFEKPEPTAWFTSEDPV